MCSTLLENLGGSGVKNFHEDSVRYPIHTIVDTTVEVHCAIFSTDSTHDMFCATSHGRTCESTINCRANRANELLNCL